MARSIGDDIAATVGVHATPEIKIHDLTERDRRVLFIELTIINPHYFMKYRFMVVASDGVWEFLSNEDVVEIVKGCAGDADRVPSRCVQYWRESRNLMFGLSPRRLAMRSALAPTESGGRKKRLVQP